MKWKNFRRNAGQILIFIALFLTYKTGGTFAEEPRFLMDRFDGGFKLIEPVEFYSPRNLYELINGQAVFYLSYGFSHLEYGTYTKGKGSFTVYVYELAGKLSSLAAYREQRETDADTLHTGAEGAITDYLAVFWKEQFYVEIEPDDEGEDVVADMRTLSQQIVSRITGSDSMPKEISFFTQEGLIPGSERYSHENLMSYSFMGRGLTARYQQTEKPLRVFLAISENTEGAGKVFKNYLNRIKDTVPVKIGALEGIKGTDRYYGTVIAVQWKKYFIGCVGVQDESTAIKTLNGLAVNLKKAEASKK